MAGGTDQSRRRLSAAIFKIEQFLYHLDRISAGGFPHNDGESALADIREVFKNLDQKLRKIPDGTSDQLIAQYFREVRDQVEVYTRILGIVLRSTNLRNNFEVYHPIKRLARRFLGEDVRLLISSEWEFIPFTYPMNIREVPDLILVGSPATEAQNLLVTPLAGHEIGHSVWGKLGVKAKLTDPMNRAVDRYFDSDAAKSWPTQDEGDSLLPDVRQAYVETSLHRKVEEVFCDFFALRTFGLSYLYAFEYYLSPGRSRVSQDYPSDSVRLELLGGYAKRIDVIAPDDIFTQWSTPGKQSGRNRLFEAADQILLGLSHEIGACVDGIVDAVDVPKPNSGAIDDITACFERFEPYGGYAEYVDIINALWGCANSLDLRSDNSSKRLGYLTELALKSVEVSEIIHKQEEFEKQETDA